MTVHENHTETIHMHTLGFVAQQFDTSACLKDLFCRHIAKNVPVAFDKI